MDRLTDATGAAAEEAAARANMYGFLSSTYLEPPSPEFLRRLLDGRVLDDLAAYVGEDFVAGLKSLAGAGPVEADIIALKQDYMGLFAVPAGRYVMPFEDVYCGDIVGGQLRKGPLLGIRAVAVKNLYHQAGAEMAGGCDVLPTHIGVELSFMGFLCEREAAATGRNERNVASLRPNVSPGDAEAYRELQMRFLRDHLHAWFPQLSKKIAANARGQFYRSMALITSAFLALEMTNLQMHPAAADLAG